MRLVFRKGGGKYDLLHVIRPDGQVDEIECPKQRIIPHDMVHFAVESELGARGFLSRVRDGETADVRMAATAESDSVERLVEALQGDAWSGADSPAAEVLSLYEVTCDARACSPLAVGPGEIDAVRARIRELQKAWDAVPVGGTLELGF
jgi:hypothetical protein